MKKHAINVIACLLAMVTSGQNSPFQQPVQQQPFVLGVIDHIQSGILAETRTLNIYLPQNYAANDSLSYPVIYLLDGSANEDFIHITGIVQFLTMIKTMPELIIVGIANIDRRKNFTFPTTVEKDKKDFPATGGSAAFMEFIEKELQPFIQKKYRTNESRTIIGQSLGGLFATEVLLKKPNLFNNYIIVSPSLWWDNESLLKIALTPPEKQRQKLNIYISVGNEGKQMEDDAKNLSAMLQQPNNINGKVYFVSLPGENHLTILHNSVYKGFDILWSNQKH